MYWLVSLLWGPQLGDRAPDSVITPDVLTADGLVFAGQNIEIVGLDSSSPHRTVLWIPESKVILGGILLDSGEHVWLADTAEKELSQTTSSADFIKAMKTHFPSLPGEQTLELGEKVLTGEMAWN